MPRKSGVEAYEAITPAPSRHKGGFHERVSDGSFDIKALSGKGAALLQKPVRPADLVRAVRRALDEA
jgi:hypothetical protein